MRLIVDRFEGKYAVYEKENLEMVDIEIEKLLDKVKEWDVLNSTEEGFEIDLEETKSRNKRVRMLIDGLWEK